METLKEELLGLLAWFIKDTICAEWKFFLPLAVITYLLGIMFIFWWIFIIWWALKWLIGKL